MCNDRHRSQGHTYVEDLLSEPLSALIQQDCMVDGFQSGAYTECPARSRDSAEALKEYYTVTGLGRASRREIRIPPGPRRVLYSCYIRLQSLVASWHCVVEPVDPNIL